MTDFLLKLDEELSRAGIRIGGIFYDEPRNKSKLIAALRDSQTQSSPPTDAEARAADKEGGKPDPAGAPAPEEDN